jgi:hypothetical protein
MGRAATLEVALDAPTPWSALRSAIPWLLLALGGLLGRLLPALLPGRLAPMRHRYTTALLLALVLCTPLRGEAEEIGTLTLDGLSFVSFGNRETLALPAGAVIRFRFGAPRDASVGFTIRPEDLAMPTVSTGGGRGEIVYRLMSAASGTMRRGAGGSLEIDFSGTLGASYAGPDAGGTNTYAVRFTTGHAEARAADGSALLPVDGVPVVPGARYVQLVMGTTNAARADIEPGGPVYAVLSGTFDRLPLLP